MVQTILTIIFWLGLVFIFALVAVFNKPNAEDFEDKHSSNVADKSYLDFSHSRYKEVRDTICGVKYRKVRGRWTGSSSKGRKTW